MKKYSVWISRYINQGEYAPAHKLGEIKAESFDDACIKLLGDKLAKNEDGSYRRFKEPKYAPSPGIERINWYNDPNKGNLMIGWSVLYSNQKDARRT